MIGALPKSILSSGKVILNQHNIEYEALASLSKSTNKLRSLIYRFVSQQMHIYEKYIYRKYNFLLQTFVSVIDKEKFEQEYKLYNTVLIPVGAEISDDCGVLENYNFLFVAKMSYPANEEGALWLINEILPRVNKTLPDAKLYLVGKDPTDLIYDASKGNENIIITGKVDSLDPFYKSCNLVVVPIMTGGGVNVKLLEALGYNKYVVTTSKGVEGTNFINSKHLFISDDPEEFANQCIEILQHPSSEEFIRMKENTKQLIHKQYSWENIVNIYNDAINNKLSLQCDKGSET